jgi:hypothetical protein
MFTLVVKRAVQQYRKVAPEINGETTASVAYSDIVVWIRVSELITVRYGETRDAYGSQ